MICFNCSSVAVVLSFMSHLVMLMYKMQGYIKSAYALIYGYDAYMHCVATYLIFLHFYSGSFHSFI